MRLLTTLLTLGVIGCSGGEKAASQDTAQAVGGGEDEGEGAAPAGFVRIPAGSFEMGCTPAQAETEYCDSDESPVHTVTLTHGFYMGETEVTQGEFQLVMGYNPSYDASCGNDCPVEYLTWYESAAYANALSSSKGLDSCYTCSGSGTSVSCSPVSESAPNSCEGYRLPTEAEWEYAARAGTDMVYAGADVASVVAWTWENSGDESHVVAGLNPNGWGLHDMSGNVHEWADDWYNSDAYDRGDSVDPVGDSVIAFRVNRGGSWHDGPTSARVAIRSRLGPNRRNSDLGFRIVRTNP